MMVLKRILCVAVLTVGALGMTLYAFAADYYLKISGIKGESARVLRCEKGVCSVDGFASGNFTAAVCDAQGNTAPSGEYKLQLTFKPSALRESPSKASQGKVARTGATEGTVDVLSPRDAASGLPTGKRQHQPITITKEWGSNSREPVKATTPSGEEYSDVSTWALEVRVDRIEMK
jgi:hypothetical protein